MVLTSTIKALLFILLLSLLPNCSTSPHNSADLILQNGSFWTGNPEQQIATAVAIRRGRLVFVGDADETIVYRGPSTELIDLNGAFVVPGFNDNHVHFASAARFLEFNIMRVRSQDEFLERARQVVEELESGEWILGGYWGAYEQWAEASAGGEATDGFTPDIALIEELTARNPLYIQKFDNSSFAVNRAALMAAGLDPERPSAPGVVFEQNAAGRPTGILRGRGVDALFSSVVPREFSPRRRLLQSRRALAEIRRYGVTSISDMSDDEQLEIYRELRSRDQLTVRVHFRPHLETWKELARQAIRVGSGDDWIRLGAVKGHIDGIMGTSSARFFEPYSHEPWNRGRWRRLMVDENGELVEGKFLGYMQRADLAGLQLSVHAIGDEANALLLDYLEELNRQNPIVLAEQSDLAEEDIGLFAAAERLAMVFFQLRFVIEGVEMAHPSDQANMDCPFGSGCETRKRRFTAGLYFLGLHDCVVLKQRKKRRRAQSVDAPIEPLASIQVCGHL